VDRLQTHLELNGEQNNQMSFDGKNTVFQSFGGNFKNNLCEFVREVLTIAA
jgi:hypothetical protein